MGKKGSVVVGDNAKHDTFLLIPWHIVNALNYFSVILQ